MRTLSPDTDPAAERVQISLLRRASAARRFGLCRSLSRTVIALSRKALREHMPNAAGREVELRWVALNYGEELAAAVARRLGGAG